MAQLAGPGTQPPNIERSRQIQQWQRTADNGSTCQSHPHNQLTVLPGPTVTDRRPTGIIPTHSGRCFGNGLES
jgi:hypothetical protein